jgi:hypothetical protein
MQTVARRHHETEWPSAHIVIADAPRATLTAATKAKPRIRPNNLEWDEDHALVERRLCAASGIEVDESRGRVPKAALVAHLDVNMG